MLLSFYKDRRRFTLCLNLIYESADYTTIIICKDIEYYYQKKSLTFQVRLKLLNV